jgi:hypothetical protein
VVGHSRGRTARLAAAAAAVTAATMAWRRRKNGALRPLSGQANIKPLVRAGKVALIDNNGIASLSRTRPARAF